MNCSSCGTKLTKLSECFGSFSDPLCNDCYIKPEKFREKTPEVARLNELEDRLSELQESLEEKESEADDIDCEIHDLEDEIWKTEQEIAKLRGTRQPQDAPVAVDQLPLFVLPPSPNRFK